MSIKTGITISTKDMYTSMLEDNLHAAKVQRDEALGTLAAMKAEKDYLKARSKTLDGWWMDEVEKHAITKSQLEAVCIELKVVAEKNTALQLEVDRVRSTLAETKNRLADKAANHIKLRDAYTQMLTNFTLEDEKRVRAEKERDDAQGEIATLRAALMRQEELWTHQVEHTWDKYKHINALHAELDATIKERDDALAELGRATVPDIYNLDCEGAP